MVQSKFRFRNWKHISLWSALRPTPNSNSTYLPRSHLCAQQPNGEKGQSLSEKSPFPLFLAHNSHLDNRLCLIHHIDNTRHHLRLYILENQRTARFFRPRFHAHHRIIALLRRWRGLCHVPRRVQNRCLVIQFERVDALSEGGAIKCLVVWCEIIVVLIEEVAGCAVE